MPGPPLRQLLDPERREETLQWWLAGRPTGRQIANLLQQLALMLANGIDLARALEILSHQTDHPRLRWAMGDVKRQVTQQGKPLSTALETYPELFPSTACLLIKAGEMGGHLDERLERAGDMLERNNKLIENVKTALMSPSITALASGIVIFLIFKFVIPKFLVLYEHMNIQLPLITQAMIVLVKLLNSRLFVVMVAALLMALYLWRARLREILFDWAVEIPFFRGLIGTILCSQFCDVVAFLTKDGVRLPQALALLAESAGFATHGKHLKALEKKLIDTGDLPGAVGEVPYFPAMFGSMCLVASESGQVTIIFGAASRLMEEQCELVLETAVALVEPGVIFVLGTVMSVFFVAMFLPIYKILSTIGA